MVVVRLTRPTRSLRLSNTRFPLPDFEWPQGLPRVSWGDRLHGDVWGRDTGRPAGDWVWGSEGDCSRQGNADTFQVSTTTSNFMIGCDSCRQRRPSPEARVRRSRSRMPAVLGVRAAAFPGVRLLPRMKTSVTPCFQRGDSNSAGRNDLSGSDGKALKWTARRTSGAINDQAIPGDLLRAGVVFPAASP